MMNKKKILIGSADPDFAFGIKSQLEGMGAFSPVLVTGARELIEVEQMFYFSVILVDALLDDYPGFEVCRKLREAGRDTPIILFSRIPEQECARIRNSWQADRCLEKSVPVPDLFDRIREVMEIKAKNSPREAQAGRGDDSRKKEEKFDGLDEMVKGDLLAEMSPESPAEPQVEEKPAAPETEPGETPGGEESLPASLAPPRDVYAPAGESPEPRPGDVPRELKPLEEEIASKLDELNETEKPKWGAPPVFRMETEEIADAAGEPGKAETDREPETAEETPLFPETEPAEEIERAEIPIIKEGETQESGVTEIGESGAHLVPWNSAMKILAVLVVLGLGLGYFLAR